MKTKFTLVQQYSKYLDAISKDNGMQIPTLFEKFSRFLEKECTDKELSVVLEVNSIAKTLHQLNAKNVSLKRLSKAWDAPKVSKCYDLINKIGREWHLNLESDTYKVLLHNFFKLAEKELDPAQRLYFYLVHQRSEDGKNFYKRAFESEIVQLLKAKTEKEIESIMASWQKKVENAKAEETCDTSEFPF